MGDDARRTTAPVLQGVRIGRYKNLRDVWIPWSDGIALFGVNGAGKTNLLETLAILMGSAQTVALTQRRLGRVQSGSLEVVAEVSTDELPWAPTTILSFDLQRFASAMTPHYPVLGRVVVDARWWEAIGVSEGDDFLGGLSTLGLPHEVIDYLTLAIQRPVIRYSLSLFEIGQEDDYEDDDGARLERVDVRRVFARTLMAPAPPEDLRAVVDHLPDVFAPLRTALSRPFHEPEGLVDVLTLPQVMDPPAVLEWLPRARTGQEVNADLKGRFREALPHVQDLADALVGLPAVVGDFDPDPHWWLHEVAAEATSEELTLTIKHVGVDSLGEHDADWDLRDLRTDAGRSVAKTGDWDVLEPFSAGERRWVDEALATCARAMDRFATTAAWQSRLLEELDPTDVVAALVEISTELQDEVQGWSFWNAGALSKLHRAMEPALTSLARRQLEEREDPVARRLLEASVVGLSSVRPRTIVRVIDEPEAHLHPAAQRSVAAALDLLRLRGQNVVLSSHSPHFLDLPQWRLLHLQRTAEGATVSELTREDLHARSALAGQLGLTRGELLTSVGFVLIVEGEHDRLMLETLFADELASAGVAILRMFGTRHLLATAEMDFVQRHLHVPVGVLLDYTRLNRVTGTPPAKLRDEERALGELRRALGSKRRFHEFGLERPDVVAYLNEEAVRAEIASFPGWSVVLRRFAALRRRPSFKDWLMAEFDVDLRTVNRIQPVLQRMIDSGLPAVGELERVVREIVARAAAERQSWPPADR